MKKTSLISLLLLFCNVAFAQYDLPQNKIWIFGEDRGLDFNTGTAVPITSNFTGFEASASVSDTSGHLLFYTDGRTVYNRNGVIMPSGANIVPYTTVSAMQGAVIAPVIGSANRYYIFSMEDYENVDPVGSKLSYSIVNMTLDGGLGGVETTAMGILMETDLSESAIAIPGDLDDIWLVSHTLLNEFVSFHITAAGVGPATYTATGDSVGNGYGYLKANPSSTKIVYVSQFSDSGVVSLFNFDQISGTISDPIVLDTSLYIGSPEFSSDGSKLYIGSLKELYQYDLSVPTAAAIYASKYQVCSLSLAERIGHLRLAPNGKIYFRNMLADNISSIEAPNSAGASCNFVLDAVVFPTGADFSMDLPSLYVVPRHTTPTSVTSTLQQATTVFPDPASDRITISATEKIRHVSICDLFGREVYTATPDAGSVQVDITSLTPGIYCIKTNGVLVQKFIKG